MMKLLLLTDMPPTRDFTAGIVLEQLISFLPRGSLACFVVLNKYLDPSLSRKFRWIPIKYREKPRENWVPFFRHQGYPVPRLCSVFAELFTRQVSVRSIVQEVISFGQKQKVDALWCILEGQTMIRLALPVAQGLHVPLLTEVWDPPGWWMRDNQVDLITRVMVLREFAETVSKSAACATASPAMAKEYAKRYTVKTVTFLPSLDPILASPPAEKLRNKENLKIGIAGQLYANHEWNALLDALQSVNWKLENREVGIRLIGNKIDLETRAPMHVEYFGWRRQDEMLKLLSECDILYLPYWFSKTFEEEARLSFPSKLTSYLAAGRPVFFHGPEYASPALFLKKHDAGMLCYSLRSDAIIGSLRRLVKDKEMYRHLAANGHEAFLRKLTLRTLRMSFEEFLAAAGITI